MSKPRLMFYQDGRHALIYTYEPPMQKQEYEQAIDELLGTPVDTLVFCLGEGRTMLHDTKAGEFWGHNVDKWPHETFRRVHQNAKRLIEEGNDPLMVICERSRSEGLLIYPSLNVQWDSAERGGEDTVWVRVSDFRFDNKQFEIGAGGGVDPNFPGFGCFDFKHKEVRDERFAIIEETVNNYPVDGFEVNLNNFPWYFHPDEVDAGLGIMTEWIARVYEAVKKSGPDRELTVRVANGIEICESVGLDLREWTRQGIVDVLIAQDEASQGGAGGRGPSRVNQMADFRPLVEAADGSSTRVFAAIQSELGTGSDSAPIEMTRATACNYWDQGIDGLFLDRGWFVGWPYGASFYETLRELPHPQLMIQKDKAYHVLTGPRRADEDIGLESPAKLPATLEVGKPAVADFTISDDLPRWDSVGRVHDVLLRVGMRGSTELDRFSFKLNGKELPEGSMRTINMMYRMSIPRNRRVGGYWFVFRPDRDYWPVKGGNSLEVTLLERDPDVTPDVSIEHVELETKYLMGKNFYHGEVDPDLGSFRYA